MVNRISYISHRQAARVAGTAILIMAVLAGFAYGYVLNSMIVPGNANSTVNNIIASELLFRAAIFSFLIVLICDVVTAWALYIFLKQVNQSLSLLTAWLRLIYATILGTAILNFLIVLLLISGTDNLKVFESTQINALVLLFLKVFDGIWSIGLVVFGCHLFVLGYLSFKSGYIPKFFGVLLIVASLCYFLNNSASLLISSYERYKGTVESILSVPMIIGELGFGLWLLFKGGKVTG